MALYAEGALPGRELSLDAGTVRGSRRGVFLHAIASALMVSEKGEGWQRQSHIYSSPFYYIDYCLAQTVSLEFWSMQQKDRKDSWEHYMAYTRQGGTEVFTTLLANAGLVSPFDENCLKEVCETAMKWLDVFDMSTVE